jgi:hypothetical protein
MARHVKTKRFRKKVRNRKYKSNKIRSEHNKYKRSIKRRPRKLNEKRLQRGLRVLQELKDLFSAAQAAGVSPKEFAKAALAKGAIRKQGNRWIVRGGLPRRMLLFSGGREVAITVRGIKAASLIGGFMGAVGRFARNNDPEVLSPFVGRSVKDIAGKSHVFETNPNALYRLLSAGDQPFEQIYKIIV